MEVVERLNNLLVSFDECHILSFDGSRLVVIGDFDLSYHHNFEAEFLEVSYIQCPTYFNAQVFRLATQEEREQLGLADYTENQDKVFCFEADEHCFFIIAQRISVREALVLHQQPSQ